MFAYALVDGSVAPAELERRYRPESSELAARPLDACGDVKLEIDAHEILTLMEPALNRAAGEGLRVCRPCAVAWNFVCKVGLAFGRR